MVSFSFEVHLQLFVHHDHSGYCTLPTGPNRTSYFEALPSSVHLVYNREITQTCRVEHLEPFSVNGLFVHLLEVTQKSFKNHSVHSLRRSLYQRFLHTYLSVACVQLKLITFKKNLRSKKKYLDRMDPEIWLVFHLKFFANLYTMTTTVTLHYLWGLNGPANLKPAIWRTLGVQP